MKQRIRVALMSFGALATGVAIAAALAIPAGVFAETQPLVGGLVGRIAPQPVTSCDRPQYYGYATVRSSVGGIQPLYAQYVTAWQWSNGWIRTSRPEGERVYLWPYATGWTWTWTSQRGWLAMNCERLVINYNYDPPIIVT